MTMKTGAAPAMTLHDAARAVLKRWDSPQWDWHREGPTADLMADLRAALAARTPTAKPAAWRWPVPKLRGQEWRYTATQTRPHAQPLYDKAALDELAAESQRLGLYDEPRPAAERDVLDDLRRAAAAKWRGDVAAQQWGLFARSAAEIERLRSEVAELKRLGERRLDAAVAAERQRRTSLAADFQEYLYRVASQVPFEHAEWAQQRGAALLAALKT